MLLGFASKAAINPLPFGVAASSVRSFGGKHENQDETSGEEEEERRL